MRAESSSGPREQLPRSRNPTDKQQRWIEEYLKDFNATAAAVRAGYSEKTARQIGAENLSKPVIQEALQAAQSERARTVEVDAQRVLREYLHLAFNDLREIFVNGPDGGLLLRPVKDWPESIGRSLAGIKVRRNLEKADDGSGFTEVETVEFKLSPKTDALEKLARHLGLFAPEKHEHKHEGSMSHEHSHQHQFTDEQRRAALDRLASRLGLASLGAHSDAHRNGNGSLLDRPAGGDGARGP